MSFPLQCNTAIDKIQHLLNNAKTMKKKLIIFLALTLSTITIFAKEELNTDIVASVKAVSNSEAKIISSKIDGERLENKIQFNMIKYDDGSITIISEYFKLGKMPFSSYFSFTIKKEDIKKNEKGEYIIKEQKGFYKVLASKKDAFLTGIFNEKTGKLVLTTQGRGRTLTIEITY